MSRAFSEWRLTLRLKAALGTQDDLAALAYACFLWGALLRCGWLVLDLLGSEALGAVAMVLIAPLMLVVLATTITAPLADLAGAALAFRRPREAHLLLMTVAAAAYWARGWIAPGLCGTASGTSAWVVQFCDQASQGALGLALLAACLDRLLYARYLPAWARAVGAAALALWLNGALRGDGGFLQALSALGELGHGGVAYDQLHAPIREAREASARVAGGILAILGVLLAISLAVRTKAGRAPPQGS